MESSYLIRFSDCDPFGHLNNARYIDYLLNAREDHIREHYPFDLDFFYKKGIGWFVTAHEIQYLRPAGYNETVVIESDLLEAGGSHLLVEMRMWDATKKRLKALLWTHFACVGIKTGRREQHPPEFQVFIESQALTEKVKDSGIQKRAAQLSAPG